MFAGIASLLVQRLPRHLVCACTNIQTHIHTHAQHVKEQYEALSPVLETLAQAYPQFISRECVAWDSYVWAVECWYAYAIQVRRAWEGFMLKLQATM